MNFTASLHQANTAKKEAAKKVKLAEEARRLAMQEKKIAAEVKRRSAAYSFDKYGRLTNSPVIARQGQRR